VQEVLGALANAFTEILGPREVGLAVHGSAVTDDFFPGISDVDLAVVLDDELALADSKALAGRIDGVAIAPFAYVQATYHEAAKPQPSLVPGASLVLRGAIDDGFMHSADSLASAAAAWLEKLPTLLEQDVKDWSVSVGRRPRQLRLILTRLKPTVRAKLVTWGEDPVATYGRPWPQLIEDVGGHESNLANDLSAILRALKGPTLDPLALGARLLDTLTGIDASVG